MKDLPTIYNPKLSWRQYEGMLKRVPYKHVRKVGHTLTRYPPHILHTLAPALSAKFLPYRHIEDLQWVLAPLGTVLLNPHANPEWKTWVDGLSPTAPPHGLMALAGIQGVLGTSYFSTVWPLLKDHVKAGCSAGRGPEHIFQSIVGAPVDQGKEVVLSLPKDWLYSLIFQMHTSQNLVKILPSPLPASVCEEMIISRALELTPCSPNLQRLIIDGTTPEWRLRHDLSTAWDAWQVKNYNEGQINNFFDMYLEGVDVPQMLKRWSKKTSLPSVSIKSALRHVAREDLPLLTGIELPEFKRLLEESPAMQRYVLEDALQHERSIGAPRKKM